MKKIIYAGTEVVTGDEIALTLLALGQSLAQIGSAATVEIPILEADGSRGTAAIIIGPASQIVVMDAAPGDGELSAPDVVEELRSRIRRLTPTAEPLTAPPHHADWPDDL